MQSPTPTEAIKIIKEVLDAANKSGMFENLESAVIVNNAFIVVNNEINKTAIAPGS